MDRIWAQDRLWLGATGTAAAIVFLVTFLVVSSVSGSESPTPSLVTAPPDSGPIELDDPTVDMQPDPSDADPDASDDSPTDPAPDRPARPLPEFDAAALIHGGTGRQGAILGGPGIVRSSGEENRTDWELIIPGAQIQADVVKVGLTPSNALGAPDNPEVIGWWKDGPRPGQKGNVLLDGHRDYTDTDRNVGTGVCWLLPNVTLGDFILIRDNAKAVHYLYTVEETTSVIWNDPDAVSYLQPTPDARLTLVTCEGAFDGDAFNYSNRRIVVATLTDTIPFAEQATETAPTE